jgi:hypothetical protein
MLRLTILFSIYLYLTLVAIVTLIVKLKLHDNLIYQIVKFVIMAAGYLICKIFTIHALDSLN